MDLIKAELERKKKERAAAAAGGASGAASSAGGGAPGGTKFFRRGDLLKAEEERRRQEQERLERQREERDRKRREEEGRAVGESLQARLAAQSAAVLKRKQQQEEDEEAAAAEGAKGGHDGGKGEEAGANNGGAAAQGGAKGQGGKNKWLPFQETQRRLRALGQPVTLFGEDEEARLGRLATAEAEAGDMATEDSFALAYDYQTKRKRGGAGGEEDEGAAAAAAAVEDGGKKRRRRGQGMEEEEEEASSSSSDESEGEEEETGNKKATAGGGKGGGGHSGSALQQQQHKKKPAKEVSPSVAEHRRIYAYYRGLLKHWERDLNARPDEAKRTLQGKMETKTQKQCKDYIRPLFKLCKAKQIPDGIRSSIVEMVEFCEQGEFVKAHEVYLRTAIGNAPWPIGLTMVGIHERTGREKISSSKVAHIMNNEMQRKYLTSIKRLMRFAQDKRPDVLPSKKFF